MIFKEAGAEWRGAGCSMCLGMNPDQLAPGERSASTSNRNFEGRQGKGGRTHLVSPPVAAATAVTRHPRRRPPTCRPPSERRSTDMEKFTTHTGTGVPLRRSNVDTDQIIPAVYLKRVTRTGFEDGLFAAWRNDPAFVLNQPGVRRAARCSSPGPTSAPARRASTRSGPCRTTASRSSSRRGSRDIFRGNSGKAGLLAAQVDAGGRRAAVGRSSRPTRARRSPSTSSRTTVRAGDGVDRAPFDIDDYTRWRLLEGLDDIGITLSHEADIAAFEATRPAFKPATGSRPTARHRPLVALARLEAGPASQSTGRRVSRAPTPPDQGVLADACRRAVRSTAAVRRELLAPRASDATT